MRSNLLTSYRFTTVCCTAFSYSNRYFSIKSEGQSYLTLKVKVLARTLLNGGVFNKPLVSRWTLESFLFKRSLLKQTVLGLSSGRAIYCICRYHPISSLSPRSSSEDGRSQTRHPGFFGEANRAWAAETELYEGDASSPPSPSTLR